MNGKIISISKRLQTVVEELDHSKDRDTLLWAHGFLTSLVTSIQVKLPELTSSQTQLEESGENLRQSMAELNAESKKALKDDLDSLEKIARDLDDSPGDDLPVPVNRKSGPKGRSGGAAVPLPDPGVQ